VLHRDIKLDNILLDEHSRPKICDFGVSRFMVGNDVIKEQCGTPAYIAPEIIEESGYSGFTADNWSLGVLLYAMTTGSMPFRANTIEQLHKAILRCDYNIPAELDLTDPLCDMIVSLLVREPTKRLQLVKIFSHPWMKSISSEDKYRKLIQDHLKQTLQNISEKENIALGGKCPICHTKKIPILPSDRLLDNSLTAIAKSNSSFSQHGVSHRCNCTESLLLKKSEDLLGCEKLVLNEDVLDLVERFGFKRNYIKMCVTEGRLTHASACYFSLVKDYTDL
jgi:serine/threonine protein kinase